MVLPTLSCLPADEEASLPPLPLDEDTLTAVIDEIIPAEEGMPSASEAGALRYFRQLAAGVPERLAPPVPDLVQTLGGVLEAVEAGSRERFTARFLELSAPQRIAVLVVPVTLPPFGAFSTLVYEAYYVQPTVWEIIGYEPFPTGEAGPRMEPFDDAALDRVRATPTLYREVR